MKFRKACHFLRRRPAALLCFLFLVFVFLIGIFAQEISPFPFDQQEVDRALNSPDWHNWLGADALGRDLLSRIIYGSRISMAVGIVTALISLLIGGLVGSLAGWFGGWIDSFLMRVVDILYAIPSLVLLILMKVFFDSLHWIEDPETKALVTILLSLSIVGWIGLARLVRAQILQAREFLYVEGAKAMGASEARIVFCHIFPNIIGPILVMLTFQIPSNILFESFLSFIGLGLQPPYSSWGTLASDGWRARSYFHLIFFPGLILFLTILAFNLLGDSLQDAWEPKQRLQRLTSKLANSIKAKA